MLLELELLELLLLLLLLELEEPGELLLPREAVMPRVPELPALLGPPFVLNWMLVGCWPVKPVLVMHWKHVTCMSTGQCSKTLSSHAQQHPVCP